jgi:PAS domain S-box-containing protein
MMGSPMIRNSAKDDNSQENLKEIEAEQQSHRQNLEALVARRTHELNQKIKEAAEAEKALKNHLAVMDAFIDTMPAPVFFKDGEGRYQGCNTAFADMILGLTREEIIGHTLFELETAIPRDLAKIYHQRDLEMLKGGNTQVYEAPVKCADGEFRHFFFSKATYTDAGGRISGLVGVMADITHRKQSEEELARLTSILEATNDLVSTATPDGRITYMNRAGRRMLGWDEDDQTERNIAAGHPPWACEILKNKGLPEAIDKGIWSGETALLGIDGSEIPVSQVVMSHKDRDGRLLYLSTIIRDISEIKCAQQERIALESRLRQAQKMESIGTLAGGIAHDFNNILGAILGYTEITLEELPSESCHRQNLEKVLRAGQRARDLVHQILTFSRQTEHEVRPMRVKPIVEETLKLLRATLPATIIIAEELDTATMVMADPIQIHQAVMNLCTNAAHAMQADGGRLTVRLYDASLNGQFGAHHRGLEPGNYLVLQVADTGHGMNAEVKERIFDPFFTTKSKGEGTGLGLSVVHGIITSSSGAIDVESAPGQGTTFTIYLPSIEDHGNEFKPAEISLPRGTESILFVDDEEFQADVGQRMLKKLGYRVRSVTSSREALELFLQSPDTYDLLITDMTMPQMTGDVLAGRIRQHSPDLPVIICTGFSNRMDEKKAKASGIASFLNKPILMKDLAAAVRKVLDEKRRDEPGTTPGVKGDSVLP